MKWCLLTALVCVPAALAQSPAPPPAQIPVLTTRTTLVLVPVLVRTKDEAPVFTLSAKDFALTDDGIEEKITVEDDTGSEPLALVVAVETGGAGARQLENFQNLGLAIETVIGSVPHRVAVVEFDSAPRTVQSFTSDLLAVDETLQGLAPGDRGAAILDGLRFSVDLLRSQPAAYRRVILLLSETVDHGSQTKLDEALRALSDSNTAIYSLAFPSAKSAIGHQAAKMWSDPTPGPPGGCMAKDPSATADQNRFTQAFDCLSLLAPPLRLAKMAGYLATDGLRRNVPESVAQLTGGEYFSFSGAHSLERDLLTISHHLPNRYMLSYYPASPHPGFHAIGLRLNGYSGLVVKARSGYWVDSEAETIP